MCEQERHLITSIMLGDLAALCGHQFVYGWYLRHTIRAEILLWLMGRTEGLDCQSGVSPHFSFQASKVPPAHPCIQPPISAIICQWWLSSLEYRGVWERERVSISISFPDKSVFLHTKAWDNLFLIPLCHSAAGRRFVFYYSLSLEMGQAHGCINKCLAMYKKIKNTANLLITSLLCNTVPQVALLRTFLHFPSLELKYSPLASWHRKAVTVVSQLNLQVNVDTEKSKVTDTPGNAAWMCLKIQLYPM